MSGAPVAVWRPGDEIGSIIQRFNEIVALNPDGDALRDTGRVLTYRELSERAAALAHAMRANGNDGPVSLVLDHRVDVVVAILAALSTGRPYTVLDPSVPAARHRHIVDDFRPALIVTDSQRRTFADTIVGRDVPVLAVDVLGDPGDAGLLPPGPGGDTIAGVYYTSGSTGTPKGVMRSHRTILHRVALDSRFGAFGPSDVMSLLYSTSFGTSVNDIFTALLNGATLSLLELRDVGAGGLAHWLDAEQVSVLHAPIDVVRRFVETVQPERVFPTLRMVIPSGRIYRRDIERLCRHLGSECTIVSRYASTETSLVCRLAFRANEPPVDDVIPVGSPVADTHVELLGEDGRPVQPGATGEFFVTSRSLSPGYWGNPEATSRAFAPAEAGPGWTRYRTGDLGRQRRDGMFEFVGRQDDRVKVRGHRVELSEVTAALYRLDDVADATVVQDRQSADGRLVAYVVMDGEPGSVTQLRSALTAELPDSMIPSLFVVIDALPLTANGRVDHAALPRPDTARPTLDTPFATPSTATQKEIATIWQDVLGIAPIGLDDRFVELGGDSLTAMRIVARVLATFAVDVSVRSLLEEGTVASMAGLVAQAESTETSLTVPIPLVDDGNSIPLSFGQQSLWLAHHLTTEPAAYNMAKTLEVVGPLDVEVLRTAIESVVHRHEVLRTTYQQGDNGLEQVVMPVGAFSVEVIDLSGMTAELRGAAEAEHLDRTQSTPFDLEADSILRATLIRHDHHRHVLSLVNHHIAGDRWSTTIMLREIAAGYRQLAGTGPPLAPPPVQYRDFAAWQRERFADPADNDGADRWAKRFSERGASLDPIVPAGAAPTPGQEPKHVALGVPPETVAGLVDRAARSDATLFMVVLAALASAIRNHTDTASITVGSLFSGRTRQEFENLIGYFANVVPLTCELPRDGHRAALEAAREATSQGFRHADIPFEYLVRRVNPQRIPGRLPMIDALLSFAEPGPNQFQLGPARARRRRHPSGVALAPIDITLRHEGAELTGAMLIDPSLVDGAVAASIAERFVAELELLAHPTEPGG